MLKSQFRISVLWVPLSAAAAVGSALALAPPGRLIGYPFTEDAYYSLSIARQIGLGHGVTIDGTTWTNGFQPLWVFLLAPAYWMASGARLGTLRAVVACSTLVWIATALMLGASVARLTRKSTAAFWTVTFYLTSRTIFDLHFNGLETGLLLFMFTTIGWLMSGEGWTSRRTVVVAIACGLLVLTRIDAALFVVLLSATIAAFPRSDSRRARVSRATGVALGSAIVSFPWWAYNQFAFGSVLPSSGSAVFDGHWRPGRALVLSLYSAAHAVPLPLRPFWPWRYEWCAAAAVAIAVAVACRRVRSGPLERVLAVLDTTPAACFVMALVLYTGTIIAVYAMSPAWWMYERYTCPVVVLSVPALALAAAATLGGRGALPVASISVLCLIAGVREQVLSPINGAYQNQLAIVARHVPNDTRVAAMQSGTLGYFRDNVVNLDGKVNAAALHARGHLDEYLKRTDVDWVADWPWLVENAFGSVEGWRVVDRVSQPHCPPCDFVLYTRATQSP